MLEDAIAEASAPGTYFEAEAARGYRMLGTSASVLVEYDRAEEWITQGLAITSATERWNDHHYLRAHLSPSYRVEAVDTAGHWEAAYLAEAGIPIVRGWFRQSDFPQNEVLYDAVGRGAYLHWLRSMGVRYVVLTTAPVDYSARREALLLRGGRSGLPLVFRSPTTSIYRVPHPRPIVTGPARASVLALHTSSIAFHVAAPGTYHVAVRYTPYLRLSSS
jgi:hypothetical protein